MHFIDQFKSPLMRLRARIFLFIVRREVKMMSIFAFLEIAALISVLGMTALLLIYFDAAPLFVKDIPLIGLLQAGSLFTLAIGVGMGLARFVAKLLQGMIDARVTSNREAWYSERIRQLPEGHRVAQIPLRELARGSHYYGRLAGASLHIVASAAAFGLTLLGLLILLPNMGRLTLLGVVVMGIPAILLVAMRVARMLKESSVGLVDRARDTALWKGNRNLPTTPEVAEYYRMYFYRIFLVGIFGHLSAAFMALLLIVVLINEAFSIVELTFGGLFFAFLAAQYYLGALSQLVTNCVKTAAFLPFVEPVFDPNI